MLGEVPYHRRQHVLSFLQEGGDIHRLEAPVLQIPPGRSGGNRLPIHEQAVAIISRDMNDKRFGLDGQVEAPPEVVNTEVLGIGGGMVDPPGRPRPFEQVWIGSGGPHLGENTACDPPYCQHQQNTSPETATHVTELVNNPGFS